MQVTLQVNKGKLGVPRSAQLSDGVSGSVGRTMGISAPWKGSFHPGLLLSSSTHFQQGRDTFN